MSRSWVVDVDGSGRRVDLGSFSDGSWGPTWSPDGQHLALAAEQSLFVVDRDGANRRKLTHGAYGEVGSKGEAAEWSPDGTMLVFAAGVPAVDHKVYVVGFDGAGERIISGRSLQANAATWSPDGNRIAYMRAGTGTGPLVAITDVLGTSLKVLPGHYAWYQPSWSPDGTKIIVTDDRPGPNDVAGPAVRVILDVDGDAPPIEDRRPWYRARSAPGLGRELATPCVAVTGGGPPRRSDDARGVVMERFGERGRLGSGGPDRESNCFDRYQAICEVGTRHFWSRPVPGGAKEDAMTRPNPRRRLRGREGCRAGGQPRLSRLSSGGFWAHSAPVSVSAAPPTGTDAERGESLEPGAANTLIAFPARTAVLRSRSRSTWGWWRAPSTTL